MKSALVFLSALLAGAWLRAAVYEVTTDAEYAAVPWLTLAAGDQVNVHWKADPYRVKIYLHVRGTAAQPIHITGIPGGSDGKQLPEISGQNAVTPAVFKTYDGGAGIFLFGSTDLEDYGTIIIHRAPLDAYGYKPGYIVIEDLKLTGGYVLNTFTSIHGTAENYGAFSSAIHAFTVENLTIRGCEITNNGIGLFVGSRGDEPNTSRQILVEHNRIYGNGVLVGTPDDTSGYHEHNIYTEAVGVTFQYNYFGRLRSGSAGSTFKDRSAGLVFRYNWVEASARALDIVESQDGYPILGADPSYNETWIYGNVVVNDVDKDPSAGNPIHYGYDTDYVVSAQEARKGPHHFYNNTVINTGTGANKGGYSYFEVGVWGSPYPTDSQIVVDIRDNILYTNPAVVSGTVDMMETYGTANLGSTNWVSSGWQNIGPYGNAAVNQNGTLIQGTNPGFTNPATLDYSLATTSPAVGQAPALPSGFQPVLNMFKAPADGVARGTVNDLGAFEGSGTGSGPIVNPPPPVTTAPATPTGLTATPASATSVALSWTSVSNATSYNIQRRIGSGAFASLTTGVSGTSYTDNSAAASTTYGYQVNATNSAGTSSWSATVSTTTPASGGGTPPAPGQMPDYTGPLFPADNVWRAPVDTLPVDSHSAAYVGSIGSGVNFHPDFGTSYGGAPIGIPYNTVGAGQAKIPIAFEWSANGSYPIPPAPLIEGLNAWNDATDGDRHLLIVDTSTSKLYETWYTFGPGMPPASGSWSTYPPANPSSWWAGSGIVFDLTSDALPPDGDTSSDAAGLPVFPGLVRYDEVTAGQINHALRFTAQITRSAHVWPARHDASSNTSANVPPMGQRFRLKASVDISGYSAKNRVILTALKKYGCFLADNGGNWFFSGTHDDRWDDSDLNALKSLKGGDFEAVDISQWLNDPAFNVNSAAVPGGLPPDTTPPSRPANLAATVVSSTTVTLSWTASTDNTGGTGVAGYRVYRGTTLAGSPTGPSFQDTGLSPSMTYNYTVIAVDGAGNPSPASSVLTVVTASLNGTGGGATTSSVTLLETAAFPNPAVGKDPTIRAFVGDADELEITIYDAAGGVVHSDRVAGGPTGTGSDGRPYYDYVWTAKKASGVYYAIIHGKKGGAIVRGRVKFAVVK